MTWGTEWLFIPAPKRREEGLVLYVSIGLGLALVGLLMAYTWRRPRVVEAPWGTPVERHRDFHALAAAFRSLPACPARARHTVSDRTWKDLSLDALFARLDRCVTSAGQLMLYRRLREPALAADEVAAFARRVEAFEADPALRDDVRRALAPLAKTTALGLAPLLEQGPPALPRRAKLIPLATIATVGSTIASLLWPFALVLLLVAVVGSIAIRLWLHAAMTTHATALSSLTGLVVSARDLSATACDALQVDAAALRTALAPVERYRAGMWWLTIDPNRLNEVVASLTTYLNVFFLLDVHAFMRSVALVRRYGPELRVMLETVGDADAARSIASFRAGTKTCTPSFTPRGSTFRIDGVRHPLVDQAVANDVRLDVARGWLVMGSNMAGKSTCLRAIATSALLAQAIACVPADAYAAPLVVVRTMIQVEDDLLAGKSHFLAEAEAGRDILLEPRDDVDRLCIVDELFRGTNTADRVAAAGAFLLALNRERRFVVAATHDTQLVELLRGAFLPHYFQERVEGSRLTFDYRLREGPIAPRNAFAVLELVGFPERVVDDARALGQRLS